MKSSPNKTPKNLRFPKGSVIIEENDVSSEAYIIISGMVEIFKKSKDKRIVLARLGPGQIFGEMALILEKPRNAGAVALEETVVRRIDVEAFARMLKKQPEKLAPFMKILLERFRTINVQHFYPSGPTIDSTPSRKGAPVLSGVTPDAKRCLLSHRNAFKITVFPFKIGRNVDKFFQSFISHNDLFLEDSAPFHVSRNHCSINKLLDGGNTYFIQDRGSRLGTIVNGKILGGKSDQNEAALDRDENDLILGSASSPFRFKITFSNDV